MIKIFTKEDWVPPFADKLTFVLAPAIIMVVVLLSFAVIPFTANVGVVDSNIGVLFVLAMASLGAYSVMLGGLSSNNKYALLGSLRAAAQMVSYEVSWAFPAGRGGARGQFQYARDCRKPGRRLVHHSAIHRLSHFPDRRRRRKPPPAPSTFPKPSRKSARATTPNIPA